MNLPPIIGIATFEQNDQDHYHLASDFVEVVRLAGVFPILLPPKRPKPATIPEFVDGQILSGGGDLSPVTYKLCLILHSLN